MKVLVCGGRNYNDYDLVKIVLDRIHATTPITLVVHGGASGADYLGCIWAERHKVPHKAYPASWIKHGKAAGPIRNQQMLDEEHPDLVVAFPGGRGTADMVSRSRRAGVVVEHAARERRDAHRALADDLRQNGLPSPNESDASR